MNRYTIYCTEEQTKKALELGAPLNCCYHNDDFQNTIKIGSLHYVEIPTAEQMLGWLEDNYESRKEATLAAIDAALEYLINNRK